MGQDPDITIRAGWLIDGSGCEAVTGCLLTLSDGKISSVFEITNDLEIPASCLDFSECTILPGIVDSHTHLTISGNLDPEIRNRQITDEYQYAEPRIKKHIKDYLKHGVVVIRDGGDFHAHTLRYKNECHSSDESLTIFAAGNGLHRKGRYGQLLGMSLDPEKDLAQAILEDTGPGIDHIKVVNSGLNSLREFGRETFPQFTGEELKRAVMAADSLGMKIMVHANGKLPVKLAVESGCHSIEHGFFMGDDNLKRMADKNVIWVPTACTMKAYMEISSPKTPEHHVAEKNLDHQIEQIQKAITYGVKIALGTDAGCPGVFHGMSVMDEFGILIRAGFSIEQAVMCATSNAIQIPNDESNDGTLSQGMPATFVIVNGKPKDLPESLSDVREVWINGRKVINAMPGKLREKS